MSKVLFDSCWICSDFEEVNELTFEDDSEFAASPLRTEIIYKIQKNSFFEYIQEKRANSEIKFIVEHVK